MPEAEYHLKQEGDRPGDMIVTSVEVMHWYPSEARDAGFPGLLEKELTEYSVAVGLNSEGDVVGAAPLEIYRRYPGERGTAHRAVLKEKAKKIFGLAEETNPPAVG